MSQNVGQQFYHRTQQTEEINSITISKELLEDAFKSIEFKVNEDIFYDYLLNAKNLSTIERENDNQWKIKYDNYDLYAVAQRNTNSEFDNDWVLSKFLPKTYGPPKHKKGIKHNYPKSYTPRSYSPILNIEDDEIENDDFVVNRVQGYIKVDRETTEKTMPDGIKEIHIDDLYGYMDKMIPLQENMIINDMIWILCFNFHHKCTGVPLYCIAEKIEEPQKNRNFIWRLRAILYTAKDICNLIQISQQNLPTTILQSDKYLLKMQNVIIIRRILNDPNKRGKILSKKKRWQKVTIFINEKQKNKKEKKLGIRKEDFLTACNDAANMSDNVFVLPMLLFDKSADGYSIDALWRVNIDDGLDVGITFALSSKMGNTIIPTGIHVSLSKIMVQCQLINTEQQIGDFFDGWVSNYNNLAVGDPNSQTVQYKRAIFEQNVLKESVAAIKQQKNELADINERLKIELTDKNIIVQKAYLSNLSFQKALIDENAKLSHTVNDQQVYIQQLKMENERLMMEKQKNDTQISFHERTSTTETDTGTAENNSSSFRFNPQASHFIPVGYKKQTLLKIPETKTLK